MKNSINIAALFLLSLLVFSCTPCPDCPNQEDNFTLTPDDVITPSTFTTWVTNWNVNGRGYTDTVLTEYFTMPLIDITEFTRYLDTSVVAARFYMGLEMTATDTMPHIMLVGVDSDGNPLIDDANNQYIYDVTKPCPTLCNKESLPDQ